MSNRGRPLATRKLICYVLIRLSNVLLVSSDGLTLTVNVPALRSRLAESEHHTISQLHGDHAVALARANRISTHITHPQELQALARQVVTLYVFQMAGCTLADITRSPAGRLQWPATAAPTPTETTRISSSLVATFPEAFREHVETASSGTRRWGAASVSLYLFNFRFSTDLSDPMRRESAAGSDAPASVTSSERPSGARRGTRASVRDREDDQLMAGMPPPTRAPNRRRLMVTLPLPQSLVTRGRPRSSGAAEEPSGRDADAAEDLSLFLSQDEDDNDPLPEQHDNYDGFDSDIGAGRLSESPDVVPTAEGTESTVFPAANSSGTHGVWAPTSRQRRVVEGTPLPWENRYGESLRTYATQMRTILSEVTEDEEESEDGSEVESLE